MATEDTINVVLVVDNTDLDEVLVIGYGTQSKRKLTDNIVKFDADDIEGVLRKEAVCMQEEEHIA